MCVHSNGYVRVYVYTHIHAAAAAAAAGEDINELPSTRVCMYECVCVWAARNCVHICVFLEGQYVRAYVCVCVYLFVCVRVYRRGM